MPGADGLDLVRRIRNLDPGLPVLVVTGHGTIASAVECIKAGAADYILKPMNVLRIEIPPLRERREDIPGLAAAFTREIAARLGRRPPAIAPAVMADLQAYAWPGNVRELRNVIERALILNRTDPLDSLDLPPVQGLAATARPAAAAGPDLNLRGALARRERDLLIEALRRSGGVRKEAARMLGIDQRNLGYYLHKHGIDPDDLPDPRR
jgi:DNA-binding NtrC family response regulator